MEGKILIVDDDPNVLQLLKDVLTEEGFVVKTAAGGEEAIHIFSTEHFDLVVTDIRMPEMDGLEVMRRIKEIREEVEVIILTGYATLETAVKALKENGAFDYLSKPLEDIGKLNLTVNRALKKLRLKRENRTLLNELQQAKAKLEQRVEERTAELIKANEQLQLEIAERSRVEEALREGEATYRTVLEANPDPVIVYDMEGRVIYFNPAFSTIFGWTLEERLATKMDDFTPEENRLEMENMMRKILAGESLSSIETQRYNKAGEVVPVSASGAIYRNPDGKAVGSVINLRDLREQKRLEGQLRQAQKMEAIGALAGGIAHDFNNLLQAILGYAGLLCRFKDHDESDYEMLHRILVTAKRGGELTNQLLTFSRRVASRRRPFDLNLGVREMIKLLERTIPKMIEIKVTLAEDLKIVNVDPGQMEQVFMNLSLNARDAMSGGGTLVIETSNVTLDEEFCRDHLGARVGEYVLISVSDTGHGMDHRILAHIFEPFFTTKEVGKGTGLGLAMVYGIVKNHDGYITCSSEPDKGTRFKIYLPVVELEPETVKAKKEVPVEGGSETVLLVDDEEFIRELGVQLLQEAGYRVLTAANGEIALDFYGKEYKRIDLVIMDLIMPGMGGKRCVEEILEINPQAKVLVATGYSLDRPTQEVMDAGAQGFITKPYDLEKMLKAVRQVLDRDDHDLHPG
jgi:PAS domain S-box-containing protein